MKVLSLSAYGWLMLAGIGVTFLYWSRLARRDSRLLMIYLAALVGAFVGAKAVYFLAEGWMDLARTDKWLRLATGKSILGGLFGGYLAVEVTKRFLGYRGITGDWFALVAPFGIILGRLGCWFHGCCLGRACYPAWFTIQDKWEVSRWPAVPVEIFFNLIMLVCFLVLREWRIWPGQHFHIYLIAYGVFRFAHEFLRETPRVIGILSGYQLAALALTGFGVAAFLRRRRTDTEGLRNTS